MLKNRAGFFFALAIVFLLLGILSVRRISKNSNSDFLGFYYAGRLVVEKYLPRQERALTVEDEGKQKNYQKLSDMRAVRRYPPFFSCFMACFAWLPKVPAGILWYFLNMTSLWGSFYLLVKFVNINILELWKSSHRWSLFFFFLAFASIIPFWIDALLLSQINPFICFLCLWGLHLFAQNKHKKAGFCFGAAAALKIIPVIFLFYFLIKREWKILWGASIAVIFSLLISFLFLGEEDCITTHKDWILYAKEQVFPREKEVVMRYNNQSLKYSVLAILTPINRKNKDSPLYVNFFSLPWQKSLAIARLLSILLLFIFIARTVKFPVKYPEDFACVFLLMLCLSPVVWSHYFLFASLSVFCLAKHAAQKDKNSLIFLILWLCHLPSYASPTLRAVGMSIWLVVLIFLYQSTKKIGV